MAFGISAQTFTPFVHNFKSQGFRKIADSRARQEFRIHNAVPRIGFQCDGVNMRFVVHVHGRKRRAGNQLRHQFFKPGKMLQRMQRIDRGIVRVKEKLPGRRRSPSPDQSEIRILASHIPFRIEHRNLHLDVRIFHAEQRGQRLDNEESLRRTDQDAVPDRNPRGAEKGAEHLARFLVVHGGAADVGAAPADLADDSLRLQIPESADHSDPGNPERVGKLAFGRQTLVLFQFSVVDPVDDVVPDADVLRRKGFSCHKTLRFCRNILRAGNSLQAEIQENIYFLYQIRPIK